MKTTKKKIFPISLSAGAVQSFESVTSEIAKVYFLAHSIVNSIISLTVDASDRAVGTVLQHTINHQSQPPTFFSRQLKPAEQRYICFDRELSAVNLTVRYFHQLLEGRKFTVFTDYISLTFALQSKFDKYSPRKCKHLEFMSQYTGDIRYIAGSVLTSCVFLFFVSCTY